MSKKECNLILSAGGIRSLAQIGAIEALLETGWTIKSLCGISAGSLVGSIYAHGVSIEVMKELAIHTDFLKLKKINLLNINKGLFKFNGFGKWVETACSQYGKGLICDLNIGTCSLSTGQKKVINNPELDGTLATAVEASCAIPVIFSPVEIDGEFYGDGALWSSAPVHFYEQSLLPTIVVHVQNSHTYIFTSFDKPIHTLYRVFEIFQINRLRGLKKRVQGKPVHIIEPDAGCISPVFFKKNDILRKGIIESGKQKTLEILSKGILDGSGNTIF